VIMPCSTVWLTSMREVGCGIVFSRGVGRDYLRGEAGRLSIR